ncbi:hypothetical protein [Erwinia sp.]|uniref:hypothetical protein n=1 Tax=Erwinia citreus TaxID=558 RepID=UPI003C78371A
MIQPPYSVNRSGLNHRETSRNARAVFKEGNGLAGVGEESACRGAVVITLANTGVHW